MAVTNICIQCGETYASFRKQKFCSAKCGHRNHYSNNMLDYRWRLSKLISMAKNRALDKNLDYDLDQEYLENLWLENSGCCEITGIPFELERTELGKVNPYAPSIDRVTPSLGYVKGNIRIICYQMNVALSEFGLDQFDNLVKAYIQNKGVVN